MMDGTYSQEPVYRPKCADCMINVRLERTSYCRECHNRRVREWRTRTVLTPEQRVKDNARSKAGMAKRRGHLQPEPCADCGDPKVEMHHEDYAKPLCVIWLCRKCHMAREGRSWSPRKEAVVELPINTKTEVVVSRETLPVSLAEILQRVSDAFNVPIPVLKGPQQSRAFARPRQAYCWIAQRLGRFSLPQIGRHIDRDHTTVIYAVKAVDRWRSTDAKLDEMLCGIAAELELAFQHSDPGKKTCPNCGAEVN